MKSIVRHLMLVLLLLPLSSWAKPQLLDRILVQVEEDIILQSELEQAKKEVVLRLKTQNTPLPPDEVLTKQVLEQLINTKLQVQRAEMSGIRVSNEEVDKAVRGVAKRNGLTVPQLRQALEADGVNFNHFLQNIRNELIIGRLRQRVARAKVDVTDSEIDLFLEQHKGQDEEFHLAHILVPLSTNPSPEEARAAVEKIQMIRQKIEDGMDFAEAAVSYSQGQTALQGGDLGWRAASKLPQSMVDQLSKMKAGEVSEPVRGPGGLHLIKLIETRKAQHIVKEIHPQHILVKVDDLTTGDEAYSQIQNIYQQLQEGKDFATLAKKFSDDKSSASVGGDMDWQPLESFGGKVRETLEKLQPGEYSEPFRTSLGWHIMKLLDRRERDRTQDFTRSQAMQAIRERKAEYEVENFLRQLRDEAYVRYLVDLGQ